jgi:hypothetical protein
MKRYCIFINNNVPLEWTLRLRRNDCLAAVENKLKEQWVRLRKNGFSIKKVIVTITPQ